jgi:hypothetical protein
MHLEMFRQQYLDLKMTRSNSTQRQNIDDRVEARTRQKCFSFLGSSSYPTGSSQQSKDPSATISGVLRPPPLTPLGELSALPTFHSRSSRPSRIFTIGRVGNHKQFTLICQRWLEYQRSARQRKTKRMPSTCKKQKTVITMVF